MIGDTHEPQVEEFPPDAPDVPPHYLHGAARSVVRYGYAFVVAEYGNDCTEELTWRDGRWTFKPHPGPLPLFGYELLIKRPDEPVMVVDDAHSALLLREKLAAYVIVSWARGPDCVLDSDWSVLKDRDVILWPNGGELHVELVELLKLITKRVRVIDTRGETPGSNGWFRDHSGCELRNWATERLIPAADFKPPVVEEREHTSLLLDPAHWDMVMSKGWEAFSVDCNRNNVPHGTVANIAKLIRGGCNSLSFDEFTGRVTERLGSKERPWTAQDSADLAVVMQERLHVPTFSTSLVAQGVLYAARRAPRHSLQDWLVSLSWDRKERLPHWLADCLNVEKTPYTEAVARNWLTAMVARAFEPGCSMPAMLVLERATAGNAAAALAVLAGPWYDALRFSDDELGRKLQGKWLVEFANMNTLTHLQSERLREVVMTRTDVYRERGVLSTEAHRRVALFAAISDDLSYRTGSHVWGVECRGTDLVSLGMMRDQLFAEAYVAYKSATEYTQVPTRYVVGALPPTEDDEWTSTVMDYAKRVWDESCRTHVRIDITTSRILKDALHIPLWQQQMTQKWRVAGILRGQGWVQKRDKSRYWRPVIRRT